MSAAFLELQEEMASISPLFQQWYEYGLSVEMPYSSSNLLFISLIKRLHVAGIPPCRTSITCSGSLVSHLWGSKLSDAAAHHFLPWPHLCDAETEQKLSLSPFMWTLPRWNESSLSVDCELPCIPHVYSPWEAEIDLTSVLCHAVFNQWRLWCVPKQTGKALCLWQISRLAFRSKAI